MLIKGVIHEDFVNYKKPSMVVEFPICKNFKCGKKLCQNSPLAKSPSIDIPINTIVQWYIKNSITQAILFQGLDPFDSKKECKDLIAALREKTDDDIVIYTGYTKKEIYSEVEYLASKYPNIIIKFGRYIPSQAPHLDPVLGVQLASDNQYAEKIS